MTIIERRSGPGDATSVSRSIGGLRPLPSSAVLDTTELRWFTPGPLPTDVGRWFTGSTGVVEERCDTYLVDGCPDIGVKRRFGTTLELKVRQSLDGPMRLGEGLAGSLEVWRRWSPVEGRVDDAAADRWVDVCKSIVKRRFSMNGTEVDFESGTPVTGSGCDVEVAEVTVGARQWWTCAFAAFGPSDTRRVSMRSSWRSLVAASGRPESFGPSFGSASGYPEWLTSVFVQDPARPTPRRSFAIPR